MFWMSDTNYDLAAMTDIPHGSFDLRMTVHKGIVDPHHNARDLTDLTAIRQWEDEGGALYPDRA